MKTTMLEKIDTALRSIIALCEEHESNGTEAGRRLEYIEGIADLALTDLHEGRAGLTERQAECKLKIRAFIDANGHAPSMLEVATMMGLTSSSYACRIVHILIVRGHLRHLPSTPRSLEVVE